MLRRSLCFLTTRPTTTMGNASLQDADPTLYNLIQDERRRQVGGIELIASENFTSRAVLECLGSHLTNKYAEGLPGVRYYGGNQVIDKIERLCQRRALEAYGLDSHQWGVNVQPYSGSIANLAALSAVLNPHDRLMGLSLPHGGHLSHGFYTQARKVSGTSIFWESLPYGLGGDGRIDYDEMQKLAKLFIPKLIIAGGSAYPRDYDYRKFHHIAQSVGATLLVDMSHYSGLVATKEHNNPFEFADIVTSTTHKTLRGPRSGLIFYKKDGERETKVNNAVFPMLQGGPHEHQIAAVATQLGQVHTPEYKEYIQQVKANATALADELVKHGYQLVSGGTDNHLMLVDLRPLGITGSKAERVLEHCNISTNKNSVVGDKSALTPGGLRLGTPSMTTRGLKEEDFRDVGRFIDRALRLGLEIQKTTQTNKLVDFTKHVKEDGKVEELAKEVHAYAASFPFPGYDNPFPCA